MKNCVRAAIAKSFGHERDAGAGDSMVCRVEFAG